MNKSNEKILDKNCQKANMEIIINVLIKEEMNIRGKGEDAYSLGMSWKEWEGDERRILITCWHASLSKAIISPKCHGFQI